MNVDNTITFDVEELESALIKETLQKVKNALDEKGYNGLNQIAGYLMSGDFAYISSYKDSRKKLQRLDRDKIIEVILKYYLENNK